MPDTVAIFVLVLTGAVLSLLLPFAVHRTYLLWLANRRSTPSVADSWSGPLPVITVQLPVYNERKVVGRLIDAACSLDYPRDLLQVQVLDDSTDETVDLARERIEDWRREGVDVRHLTRDDREGFKAGALARGMEEADGEFVLVLDADFVPEPDLLRCLLPPFADPDVGMVQARWDHLNQEESWLTRAQSLLLDGHFFFEQGGRWAAGRFFNFNGTAGMWRRSCLDDAGGWEADTLTEDLDLSYRAQMAGWRFVFLEGVGVPAEVPSRAGALEVQQRRWAQGGIQTARKILPDLLRGDWPWAIKLEAVVHLCGHLAHPLTLMLGLLLLPSAVARRSLGLEEFLFLDLVVFGAATVPFLLFYGAAGRKRSRSWSRLVPDVVRTLAVGIGLSAPVSRAVIRGLTDVRDPFVRTPKEGWARGWSYPGGSRLGDTLLKGTLGGVMVLYMALAIGMEMYATVPFLVLFGSGYLGLCISGVLGPERRTAPDDGGRALGPEPEEGRSPHDDAEPDGLWPHPVFQESAESPVPEEYEAA